MVRVAGFALPPPCMGRFRIVAGCRCCRLRRRQDPRQNEPGKFDFYVLALSWSPSYCEAAGERGTPPQQQCGARPYSFVVHGLWPQYENGFPEFCQNPAPRLDRNIVSSMLDLMPAPRLIFHEWDKHGICSGLPRAPISRPSARRAPR